MGIPPPVFQTPSNVLALSALLAMYLISHLQVASLLAMEVCLSKFELAENTWSTGIASCKKNNPPFYCHDTTICVIFECSASWVWTGNTVFVCGYLTMMMLILSWCLLNVCKWKNVIPNNRIFLTVMRQHPAELHAFTICFLFVLRYLICENIYNLYIACLES